MTTANVPETAVESEPSQPTYVTIHRTASFKIHNPSKRKRKIIEYAFTEYTLAYHALLEWAQTNEDAIISEIRRTNDKGRVFWASDKQVAGVLNTSGIKPKVHSSLTDALYRDVAGNLLSYYRLREEYEKDLAKYEEAKARHEAQNGEKPYRRRPPSPPTFPISRNPTPNAFGDALDSIAETSDVDEETWRYRQSILTRLQRGRYMPLSFSRPDAVPNVRNFSLLADDERGKYYALMFLLPNGHEFGGKIASQGNLRRVGHASTEEPPYEPKFFKPSRSKCAILCPLELGQWHVDEFIANQDANVRSAFLFERNGDYFLNVTFEFTAPAVEPRTIIGVDRGIAQFIAVRVLDFDGTILHQEMWSGDAFLSLQWDVKQTMRRLQKRGKDVTGLNRIGKISKHTVHELANAIVKLAVKYDSQVVLENLRYMDRRKERFRKLRATPYQKIADVLEYKLPLHGLPKPAYVSPAYTSRMCPRCLHGDKENRPDQATFHCQECGYKDNADLNAATNIALRWQARQQDKDWWPVNVETHKK